MRSVFFASRVVGRVALTILAYLFRRVVGVAALLLMAASAALAQGTTWQAALAPSQLLAGTSVARGSATDAAGDVYVTGSFSGQVGFGTTILNSAGNTDVFIAKWTTATSTWAWAVSAGGIDADQANGIAVNGANLYVTGYISNTISNSKTVLFGGITLAGASASAGQDMFVAKYTTAGVAQWARSGGGTSVDQGNGIAANSTGVFATGSYTNTTTDFSLTKFGGAQLVGLSASPAGTDVVIISYDASGTFQWARAAGGTGTADSGNGIAANATEVYITGNITNNSANSNSVTYTTSGAPVAGSGATGTASADVFVAKYSTAGVYQWAKSAGGTGSDIGYGIAVDGSSVYVTGSVTNSGTVNASSTQVVQFGGTALFSASTTGTANTDAFVAKYDNTGAYQWARAGGGTTADAGLGIAATSTDVFVTGTIINNTANASATQFGGSALNGVTSSASFADVFVARYDASGTYQWARAGGGTGTDTGYGIATTGTGVFVAAGSGTTPATFGTAPGQPVAVSAAVLGQLDQATGAWQRADATQVGGTSLVRATALDAAGDVYVTGSFTGQVTFGSTVLNSPGTAATTDIFVAKWTTATSTWAWAVNAGGTSSDVGYGIAVNGSNVYVTGSVTNSTAATPPAVLFGGVALASASTTTTANTDVFVASYSTSGTFQWVRAAGGTGADVGMGIATDGSNVYVTGSVTNSGTVNASSTPVVQFGGTALFSASTTGTTNLDVFVASYDVAGTYQWAKAAGGTGADAGNGIAVNGTKLYVTGSVTNSGTVNATSTQVVQFGGTALFSASTTGTANNDVFVASYNSTTGAYQWATAGGGTTADAGNGIAASSTALYITGSVGGSSALPAKFSGTNLVGASTTNSADAFVASFSLAGTYQWGQSGGGTGVDVGYSISLSNTGVYITGYFTGTTANARAVQFGGTPMPGSGAADNADVFVAAYDGSGTYQWARSGGGTSTTALADVSYGVAVNGPNVYVAGNVIPAATLGSTTFTSPAGAFLGFSAKLVEVPTLTSLSPTGGPVGAVITLTGTSFGATTSVSFNGTSAAFTIVSSTSITVTVPLGTTSGLVTVTAPGGTSNGIAFTVYGPLTISTGTMASPTMVPANGYTTVIVTGTGVAQLAGATTIVNALTVQASGVLLTNCQALTGAGSFTLAAGATLGICDAAGITASGATGAVQTTGTRSFASDATYLYNGTLAQVTGVGLPATVRNLTVTNPAHLTLSQALAVTQVVALNGGNLNTGTTNRLTLLSVLGQGTALVDNTGGVVTGFNNLMQRAVDILTPTNDGYHHYSSPMANTTVGDLAAPGFTPVFNDAGNYNTAALAGQVRPFPTVFGYDERRVGSATLATDMGAFEQGYVAPANAVAPMEVARGYTALVPNAVLVDFVGTFTTGPVSLTSLSRGANAQAGWQLLGNPYPSPLDWSGVAKTGMDAAMYVYHATSTYGGYYSTYLGTPGGTTIAGSPIIDAGQGFFVRTTTAGTPGSVNFTNANRVTTFSTQPAFGRQTSTMPTVTLNLSGAVGTDVFTVYADAAATTGVDAQYDAVKLANPSGLNLSALAATGDLLAIDGLPTLATIARIPLKVGVPTTGSYTLTAATLANLPATTAVMLTDALTGQTTDLRRTASYNFTVIASAPTVGRFFLNFTPAGAALATTSATLAAQVQVCPNPASRAFALLLPAGMAAASATLVNSLGQAVRHLTGTAATTVDVAGLPAGVYTLRLTLNGQPVAKRVVVE